MHRDMSPAPSLVRCVTGGLLNYQSVRAAVIPSPALAPMPSSG